MLEAICGQMAFFIYVILAIVLQYYYLYMMDYYFGTKNVHIFR